MGHAGKKVGHAWSFFSSTCETPPLASEVGSGREAGAEGEPAVKVTGEEDKCGECVAQVNFY